LSQAVRMQRHPFLAEAFSDIGAHIGAMPPHCQVVEARIISNTAVV